MSMIETDGKLFYQNNKKDNHLWSYDLKKKKSKELVKAKLKELITDGEKLYYRNLEDGKIYSAL